MLAPKQAAMLAFTVSAVLAASGALANETSPVGLWRNIDDATGKPRALVRIVESGGTLQGRVEKVFLAPDESPICTKCDGALKNSPVVGLVILKDLKKDGGEYSGGTILDPDSGKVYSSKVRLTDGGKKLNVRGFVGVSLLGRSQTWVREE
ncbi:DUF2147 domain-containing protein [Agrobacterium tumefaciens]|uniref:DUF2147 domain-containing protein n=1 Tax=Agrobacterium tumefaciens TaxID=358 RepID=UPI00157186F9|nr:DUF2147 domain-containing protein [Agrobacterium tumefaciens]MCZ7497308.1 DUF2147 domain-containing protein [Rhizobium rhizogenes]NTE56522.1 DUF2147 domain-containing protein [Agrobacterium tumefaciens]NTE74490.1 DUF2147 domain-containing protein [Agrobacterium tumefaciens]